MKYFIPEWDDRVDPRYDFLTDTHSNAHEQDPVRNDVYMWDIFGPSNVPFDGVLISKMKLQQNETKYHLVLEKGIHDFLRIPSDFETMGDCGAWGYLKLEEPPFKTQEIIDYYVRCGFNYGVSIDHLIVPGVFKDRPEEKQRRWRITMDNAREFLEIWKSKDRYIESFRPIGVAQGWDVESYVRAVRELIEIGYDYIALGGLARAPSGELDKSSEHKLLLPILKGVWQELQKHLKQRKIDVHVFGVARLKHLETLASLGVTSFDSASFLRRAWLGATSNYFSPDGKSYSALRVPQTDRSPRAKQILQEGRASVQQIQELERKSLQLLRDYDRGIVDANSVLDVLLKYDKLIGENREGLPKHFRRTLDEKPWKACPCKICREIGVEVIIFRGNNRNRRRGFHNTLVFFSKLREIVPRIFIFTNCTQEKDTSPGLVSAFQRYLPSPPFKTFWNNMHDLPVEVGVLCPKFGLIDWSKRIPYYDYKMQESDVPKLVKELKDKLKRFDKIFFIGLGLYRDVVSRVREDAGLNIEVFPKTELTEREKLDIPEYTKQMKDFREAIIKAIPEKCRPVDKATLAEQPNT